MFPRQISEKGGDAENPARPRIILASASPRRAELLRNAGFDFDIVPPDINEKEIFRTAGYSRLTAEKVSYLVRTAAAGKAEYVAKLLTGAAVIIGADTVVFHPSAGIQGKPKDVGDARRIIETLSGQRHHVFTGVAVLRLDSSGECISEYSAAVCTAVVFRRLTRGAIEEYLTSGEWEGKAGAYAIQGLAGEFVESLNGDFDNVVGLPVKKVRELLLKVRMYPA